MVYLVRKDLSNTSSRRRNYCHAMKRENVVYVELNLVKMNKGNELKLPITKKNLELLENQVYSIKSGFKQHKITQRDS